MKKFALVIFLSMLFLMQVQISQASTLSIIPQPGHSVALDSAYSNFTAMLNRIKVVVTAIGAIIVTVMWIWEGIFMLLHRDDKEGVLRFKHDLIYLVIASIIILGATVIVNLLAWIVTG
ncbi:MAG: TrbC/VirB2 family protein [Thermoplasmata archaeon]